MKERRNSNIARVLTRHPLHVTYQRKSVLSTNTQSSYRERSDVQYQLKGPRQVVDPGLGLQRSLKIFRAERDDHARHRPESWETKTDGYPEGVPVDVCQP